MAYPTRELRITVSEKTGDVSAILMRPTNAESLLVFGHGAGAGMRHAFMDAMADQLAGRGVATLRYQFPYMEEGRRSPSSRAVLTQTVRAAVDAACEQSKGLPLFAGGKSMGGRMTSLTASEKPLRGVQGLVFFGFPLHAAGRPSPTRGEHLSSLDVPTLFLQGTRDKLADLELIRPLCAGLGSNATLHVVEGGDHSFHVLKRSGRTDDEVLGELGDAVRDWIARAAS